MLTFAVKVSEELKGEYQAGILPFLRSTQDGGVRPDAKVAILPVKQQEDGTKETNSRKGTEGEGITGGEESTEAQTTAG